MVKVQETRRSFGFQTFGAAYFSEKKKKENLLLVSFIIVFSSVRSLAASTL
jgi:hypothetical protein